MTTDPVGLAGLVLPVESPGVAIGRVNTGELVTFRMFRERPHKVALVGGLWPLRVVVFRALGTGARVVVRTYRPNDWQRFGRWAVGGNDRLALLTQTQKLNVPGVAGSPVLVVHDMGRWVDPAFEQLGRWQTLLSVVPDLSGGTEVLAETDAMLAQRVSGPEAQEIQLAYRLDDETAHTLCQLTDDMLGVLGDGQDQVVWTVPSGVEQRAFGEPHRQ